MSINMKTLTQAFAKTAAVIEKTVQTTVQEVTGPKALTDYELLNQIGSAGPGLAWKLYSAKPRGTGSSQYAAVCVWMVDKRAVSEARARVGVSKAVEEAFFDVLRGDAGRLVRIRHPGVVHVVQALDETKNSMAFVTEPLLASVANTLGDLSNVGNGDSVPKELKSAMEMGLLEVKHGLLQIAESLEFLHNNARLVHRAISPESILITASGAWKLGGFGFATSSDHAGGSSNVQAFHYAEYDVEDSMLPLQPSLNYTAPELVRSKDSSGGRSSDIFSFGCLAYHLIARKPLLDCQNNVKMYMNTLNYLTSEAFSSIPPELVPDLQRMLSYNETTRPSALEFTGSPFFRDDTRLRALRFLDHMLGRDNMQKSEFLKALSDMWKDFDSRVLRYKVLPPLCAELRNVVMQPMILPMVLTIAESQDKHEFELSTLPALLPVLNSAAGETLLLIVKHADLIINKTGQKDLVSHVLPMLVRAYDDTDPRIQEEVLKKTLGLTKHLDSQLVKQALVPRVHGLALKTTVAAVRVNSLLCLGELIHTLDKQAVLDVLQTIQRCTAVDRTQPTLMCTLSVANSILKQFGTEFVAEHVLPLLAPLLTAQQLNVQQFAKYMAFFKDILRKIEEKRGVSVSDSGIPEVKSPGLGTQLEMNGTTSVSAVKKSASWDEDWPGFKKQAPLTQSYTGNATTMNPSIKPENGSRLVNGAFVQSHSSLKAVNSDSQLMNSCPTIDIEWPPRTSTSVVPQRDDDAKKFDDVDPFADWPPRPLDSGVSTTNKNAPNSTLTFSNNVNLQNTNVSNWASQSSGDPSKQYQGGSGFDNLSFDNGLGSGQSMGSLKQNHGNFGAGNSYSSKTASDIGSIFASPRNDDNAIRLAPPPSTAVGRGRGKGAHGQSRQTHKAPSGQPILDLL